MLFVRLQGCDVGCYFCDTKYTWKQDMSKGMEMLELMKLIQEKTKPQNTQWVCITGGEPLEQDILPLFDSLWNARFKIHVETSGFLSVDTVFKDVETINRVKDQIAFDKLHITISPKDLYTKHKERRSKPIDPKWFYLMSEIKVVVSSIEEIDYFYDTYEPVCSTKRPLVFQFMDNKPTKEMINHIMKKDNQNIRIMLQQHKVLELQ